MKIWIHLVWTTKNREPFLRREIRQPIFTHIRENAKEKGIYLDSINGYLDHVHCLISMSPVQSIDKIVMLIKGESSFWVNRTLQPAKRFEWQKEYFALSVSESVLGRVRNYIRRQEAHHRKKSWDEECQEFIRKYGFSAFVSG